jgi:hypothetical protein
MATTMHRLQISLPRWQMQFLKERARRDGVSVAAVIRQMIEDEAEATGRSNVDSLWEIAGIAEDHGPRIDGLSVSERPELYLELAERDSRKGPRKKRSNRKRSARR